MQKAAKKNQIMKKLILLFVVLSMIFSSSAYSQQRVKASYYADKFHGRKTASGKLYNRDSLTCAHKTLPFGTILKVKNPRNEKEIYVKVTDRGPFIKGRTIDLSYAAAKKIGVIGHGVASVDVFRTDLKQIPQRDDKPEERISIPDSIDFREMEILMDTITIIQPDNTKVANDSLKLASLINNPVF